jgi:hypothetical protein
MSTSGEISDESGVVPQTYRYRRTNYFIITSNLDFGIEAFPQIKKAAYIKPPF